MQYLMAFYEDDAAIAARARNDETFWNGWREYFGALGAAGIMVGGAPLEECVRAVTLTMTSDGSMVHDGPYADTREQLGGFVVIEAGSLDEALEWAKRCPAAREGAVEVRPVQCDEATEQPPMLGRERGKFMLSLYEGPADFARRRGADAAAYWGGWAAYSAALHEASVVADAAALREPETATVVRVRDDGANVHDGPYADTKEQLGGYLLLDVPTLEDALAWAARSPAAVGGAVEVRPVLEIEARV